MGGVGRGANGRGTLAFCAFAMMLSGACGRAPEPATAKGTAAPAASPSNKASLWHREGRAPGPIIDIHGHLSLFGIDRIEAVLDAVGIEAIINLSGGSGRGGARNRMASRVLAERLGGRVINFALPDWDGCCDAAWAAREVQELRLARDQDGFAGLKISKALGLAVTDASNALIPVDDPRLDPLWRAAGVLGMPVAIHIADPKAFWLPATPENERYEELSVHPSWSWYQRGVPEWAAMLDAGERMFARNPGTTFIAVHFGNAAEDLARVRAMLGRLPNVCIDISARVGEFGRHPAAEVRQFFIDFQDRILFGTDIGIGDDHLMLGSNGAVEPTMADVLPFYEAHFRYLEGKERQIDHPSPIQGRWKVDAIELPDEVLDKVYRANARRVLGLGAGPIAPRPTRRPSPFAPAAASDPSVGAGAAPGMALRPTAPPASGSPPEEDH